MILTATGGELSYYKLRRKPPLKVRIAMRLPEFLLPRAMAETIISFRPSPKPRFFEDAISTFLGFEYFESGPASKEGYIGKVLPSALEIARIAFGKCSSAEAKDKLIAGVECFHAQLVLVSRIDNSVDAESILSAADRVSDYHLRQILVEKTKSV